jgi:hypothetical protein
MENAFAHRILSLIQAQTIVKFVIRLVLHALEINLINALNVKDH